MILTGKQLRARQALCAGLLMMWCRKPFYWKRLSSWLKERLAQRHYRSGERRPAGAAGRALLFRPVRKKTAKTQGNSSATERIIDVIETDRAGAAVAAATRKRARWRAGDDVLNRRRCALFLCQYRGVKISWRCAARPANSVGIPARVNGGGIARVTACKGGLPVRIKDINTQGIDHASEIQLRSA